MNEPIIRTTRHVMGVETLAPVAAWWLPLVVLLAMALMAWIYVRQLGGVERRWRRVLVVLRLLTVAMVAALIFRPRLRVERTTDYGGRVAVLVDNSPSMQVDDAMGGEAAAAYARRAGRLDDGQTFYRALADLDALREHLAALSAQQRGDYTDSNRYWRFVAERRDEVERLAAAIRDQVEAEGRDALTAAVERFSDTVVDPEAGERMTVQTRKRLDALRADLWQAELAADASSEYVPAPELLDWTRLDLVGRLLGGEFAEAFARIHPRQSLILRVLHPVATGLSSWTDIDASLARPGGSDMAAALEALLAETNPMPLSAVLVASDGRWSGGAERMTSIVERYRERRVPVHMVGLGDTREPDDNAILKVLPPAFAVAGRPTPFRMALKTILNPADKPLTCRVRLDGETLAEASVPSDGGQTRMLEMSVAFPEAGQFELLFELDPVEGEWSEANNRMRVPVTVLQRPVRVVYLEERPHWQSRFTATVLARLPFVEMNRIVVKALPDGRLERGIGDGRWPSSEDALALYDMIFLGDVPPDLLTDEEWERLLTWAGGSGRTLVTLAGTRYMPAAYEAHPLFDGAPTTSLAPVASPTVADWMMTRDGAASRTTAGLRNLLRVAHDEPQREGLADDAVALIYERRGGLPVLAWKRSDDGKRVHWADPDPWLRLNAGHLAEHMSLWMELVVWSQRVQTDTDRFLAEQAWLPDGHETTIWGADADPNATVELVDSDGHATPVELADGGSTAGLARWRVPGLKPGRWGVADDDESATTALWVYERIPEFGWLARDATGLSQAANLAGGLALDVAELLALPAMIEGRTRRETERFIFHWWRHWTTVGGLIALLSAEWMIRKLAGKI